MKIIIPIAKVDETKREVWGVMAVEQPDKSREILDYESSKPFFQAWSDDFSNATKGKSLGNVRAMHGKVAAGKLIAFEPDDANKLFQIGAKIVDDNEWEKCATGVYTGFSIGGDYERRWDDPTIKGVKRYTANPSEVSLVDNPCIPGATFEAVKADGSRELRKFAPVEHAPPEAVEAAPLKVSKGLYCVAQLAQLLQNLDSIRQDSTFEAAYEKDDSKIPDRLKSLVETASKLLVDMAKEESSELTAETEDPNLPKEAFEMAKQIGELQKALDALNKVAKAANPAETGSLTKLEPHLKEIGKHVDKIASAHKDMGSSIAALQGDQEEEEPGKGADEEEKGKPGKDTKKAADATLSKAYDARLDKIESGQAETNTMLGKVAEGLSGLTLLIGQIPANPRAAINAKGVTKAEDQLDLTKQKLAGEKETPLELMKRTHAEGPTRVVFARG